MENSKNTPINIDELPEIKFFIDIGEDGMHTGFRPAKPISGGHILACLTAGLWAIMAAIAEETGCSTEEMWEVLKLAVDESVPDLKELMHEAERVEDDGEVL